MAPRSPAHAVFGEAIRSMRKERGFSQEAFAFECGLDRGYYGAIERGERNVALANMLKIAKALGVRPSELLLRAERLDECALG